MKKPSELVRACFSAYEQKDRAAIESLIAEEFTFTSPLDDGIDRATYMKRCWPNSEHLSAFIIEKLFSEGDEVFVTYLAEGSDGKKFRNTEFFRIQGEKICQVNVYFGRENVTK